MDQIVRGLPPVDPEVVAWIGVLVFLAICACGAWRVYREDAPRRRRLERINEAWRMVEMAEDSEGPPFLSRGEDGEA